jgi:hypothetical protein
MGDNISPMDAAIRKEYHRDISLLMQDVPIMPQSIAAEDPIFEIKVMVEELQASIERVDSLKDRVVEAVARSLGLAKQELETEFQLVNAPLLASISEQKGTFAAFGQQLELLAKRLDRTTAVIPPQKWQFGSILGLIGIVLVAQGGVVYLCKDAFLLQTPNGQIAKRIVELNPDLPRQCNHQLSKEQRKQLAKNDAAKSFCIVLN